MSVRILVAATLLAASGSAAAQGYQVRTWGYYDRYPYPPTVGGTFSYSAYPPMVTALDPWGRAVDMPLRPKVLYYDTPFLTPQGLYRPTSIAVMPDTRPRYIPPAQAIEPVPAEPLPTFRYDGGPANPVPDVNSSPAPAPVPPRKAKPALPPVPEVPKLPEVPLLPGAKPLPKLGPAPMDLPPVRRTPG